MTPTATAQIVAKLYTAAGRHYGKVEMEVYSEALYDIDDNLGQEACRDVIRGCDLGVRAPTPKDVIDAARSIQRRRREERVALPEVAADPPLPIKENKRRMTEALAILRKASDPERAA